MNLHVLIQVDFDVMENHSPEMSKPIAVFTMKKEADAYVAAHPPTYKGWDDRHYPQYVRYELPLDPSVES
jgi:hypothetical protein